MSGWDTVFGTFKDETQSTDLPGMNVLPDYVGTSEQPAVAEIPRSEPGISITGLLNGVSAAATTGLNIFKTFSNISTSAATADAERQINSAKIDLAKTQVLGQVDIAKTNADTAQKIAKIQAETAVAKESQILASTKGGTFSVAGGGLNLMSLGVIGAVIFGIYKLSKKGG